MKKNIYAVIMAGGSGERFWPLSRTKTPKQLLKIIGDKTMIQEAVGRISSLVPSKNIIVITNAEQAKEIKRQLPRLSPKNIIAEPFGRDTAACIALGAALIHKKDPDAVMIVTPADHVIKNAERFVSILRNAADICSRRPCLVTIGIKPHCPHTGFGYIKAGDRIPEKTSTAFRNVEKFEEKPDIAKARNFVEDGSYFWNSGIFIWKASEIASRIEKHMPALHRAFGEMTEAAGKPDFDRRLKKIYGKLEKISIDYGVMEKAGNVIFAEADFYWDDLGSWASLEKYDKKDVHGNISKGDVECLEVKDSLMVSKSGLIAALGVSDIVVIKTGDAVLVCHRSKLEELKKLVTKLKSGKKFNIYT